MELLEICDTGLKEVKKLGAEEAEIYITSSKHLEVNIEKNDIQLARSQIEDGVGIRVFKNNGLGFASISDFGAIKQGCSRAVELARQSPKDPYNKLPEPIGIKKVSNLYDPKAENFSTKLALERTISMLETARRYDPRITVDRGMFQAEITQEAIINSSGVQAEETSSFFIYYIMGMAVDGERVSSAAYEFDGVRFVDEIDVKKCATDFARKVIDSLGATKGESFKGQVILSPESVGSLIASAILFSVNANNLQKGMSRWKGKLGSPVASSSLTVEDNGLIPGGLGSSAFDREGIPPSPLTIIEQGKLNAYMYNTYTALKEKRSSTGHAAGGTSSVPGIGPTNFTIKEGETPKDELIKGVKQGVLVNRFAGFPNPLTGEFSGAVKGGWLIKNGKLAVPLCETLIQGNIYDLFTKISAISKERRKVLSSLLPWILIDDVSVTAG